MEYVKGRKSAYSWPASLVVKALAAALCLLFMAFYYSSKNPIPFRNGDRVKITVFNASCQRGSWGEALSVKLVDEPAVKEQILALCKTARPIRPLPDSVLLGGSMPYVCLTHENSRFILDFRDGNGQGAHSAGQDRLNVWLTSEKAGTDGWQLRRQWACIMSVGDYVNLYALVDGNTEGPELTVTP